MYGGGYGEGGASQFVGAGFLPSQGAAGAGTGSAKKDYVQKNQSLRAFTIKQLHDNVQSMADDTLVIDGKDVTNITVVAKVVAMEEQNLMYVYKVDDGTGIMTIKHWISSESGDESSRGRLAEIREGSYVRAIGSFQTFDAGRSLNAFSIRPVTDFNEVTYHNLQAIFQHMHNTRSVAAPPPAAGSGYGAGAPAGYGGAATAGYGAPAPAAAGFAAASGLTPIQQEVLAVYNTPDALTDAGLSVNNALARFGGKFSYAQVRDAVEVLCNEGHLYSTIDDQHYRSCS